MTAEDDPLSGLRVPPHSKHSERAALGALLRYPHQTDDVRAVLASSDFYFDRNKIVYRELLAAWAEGTPPDPVVIAAKLDGEYATLEKDWLAEIIALHNDAPDPSLGMMYATVIQEQAALRRMLNAAVDIAAKAYVVKKDVPEFIDSCEAFFLAATANKKADDGGLEPVPEITNDTVIHILRTAEARDAGIQTGMSYGIPPLDNLLGGLFAGDLVILAGRPGAYKTTCAMQIAQSVGATTERHAAFFSMEMTKRDLDIRLISSATEIDVHRLRSGHIHPHEYTKLEEARRKLQESRVHIDDTQGLTAMDIRTRTRRLTSKLGSDDSIGIVCVDYLQRIKAMRRYGDRLDREIRETTGALKDMAKELRIPVIALSQLNRKLEDRTDDRRPRMSDLRESGAIEEDADVIIFLYRDFMYDPHADPSDAEALVRKSRHGATADLKLYLDQSTRLFRAPEDRPEKIHVPNRSQNGPDYKRIAGGDDA